MFTTAYFRNTTSQTEVVVGPPGDGDVVAPDGELEVLGAERAPTSSDPSPVFSLNRQVMFFGPNAMAQPFATIEAAVLVHGSSTNPQCSYQARALVSQPDA